MSFATRIVRGPGRARRRACERRAAAAGWQVPAELTMPRLNSRRVVGSKVLSSQSQNRPGDAGPYLHSRQHRAGPGQSGLSPGRAWRPGAASRCQHRPAGQWPGPGPASSRRVGGHACHIWSGREWWSTQWPTTMLRRMLETQSLLPRVPLMPVANVAAVMMAQSTGLMGGGTAAGPWSRFQLPLPSHVKAGRILSFWEDTNHYSAKRFRNHYRLSRAQFRAVFKLLEPELVKRCGKSEAKGGGAKGHDTPPVSPEVQMACGIRFMAGAAYQDLAKSFYISDAMVYVCFWNFVEAVNATRCGVSRCTRWGGHAPPRDGTRAARAAALRTPTPHAPRALAQGL